MLCSLHCGLLLLLGSLELLGDASVAERGLLDVDVLLCLGLLGSGPEDHVGVVEADFLLLDLFLLLGVRDILTLHA